MASSVFLDTIPNYIEKPPIFEVRGDHIYTQIGEGIVFCASISTMRQAVAGAQAAIAEYDRMPDPVVPLCDLCTRHNLPKDYPR